MFIGNLLFLNLIASKIGFIAFTTGALFISEMIKYTEKSKK